jgi:hypothetical protein
MHVLGLERKDQFRVKAWGVGGGVCGDKATRQVNQLNNE